MKAFLKENKSSQFGTKLEFAVVSNKIIDENFSWEDENEEFRYHDELYDVVKIEKKEDKIVLICLKDNDENQLENQIKEIHKINKTGSSKTSQLNLKFFSLFYLEKQSKTLLFGNEKKEIIPAYSSFLQASFVDITLPPPRC
jgi:predicted RNA-binding protein